MLAPASALAGTNCLTGNPPPGRIFDNVADSIVCVNVDNRSFAGAVIDLTTTGGNHYINLYNSGTLTANAAANVFGVKTKTYNGFSPIGIVNVGNITATSTGAKAFGIDAETFNGLSPLSIVNAGGLTVTSNLKNAIGIDALTYNGLSPLSIVNGGDFTVKWGDSSHRHFCQDA